MSEEEVNDEVNVTEQQRVQLVTRDNHDEEQDEEHDEEQDDETVIERLKDDEKAECNENIYNAFLIANFRSDVTWKKGAHTRREIQFGLGLFAYMIAISQTTALFILIRVIMITSGNTFSWERKLLPTNAYSFMLWPFLIIAMTAAIKEIAQVLYDIKILSQSDIVSAAKFHFLIFKYLIEYVVGVTGSLLYFIVLASYSSSDSWE
eukprot:UN05139